MWFRALYETVAFKFPNDTRLFSSGYFSRSNQEGTEYVGPIGKNSMSQHAGSPPVNSPRFLVSEIQSLEERTKYDLVIGCEVLLRIPPGTIHEVVSKLVRLSNAYVANIDWYEDTKPERFAPHNFLHPYKEIYMGLSRVKNVTRTPIISRRGLLKRKVDARQSIFVANIAQFDA